MSKICLSMMCRNESQFISAALDTVIPFINHWVIVDTGSTDNTVEIINEKLKDIPGTLHQRPWINWGYNRTEAINLAKKSGMDFIFLLDADERVRDYTPIDLDPDKVYWIHNHFGSLDYCRPNLLSTKHTWRYVGVTHEYLMAEEDPPRITLPYYIETDSSRTGKTIERCADDARMLEEALRDEPTNFRYMFYLAQSYKDSGQLEKALKAYQRRTSMGGWVEEIWCSLFQIANLKNQLSYPEDEIICSYLRAYEQRPCRAGEALGALSRYLRLIRRHTVAVIFAEIAKNTPFPSDQLFIDAPWYHWMALDEFAISAYWAGRYKDSLEACNELLTRAPVWEIDRIKGNREFAMNKLNEGFVGLP